MYNVPDDWGDYYSTCPRCHGKYHSSEGGCGCTDDLETCQCGKSNWGYGQAAEDARCTQCGTGPAVETHVVSEIHVARIAHGNHINPGDTYRRRIIMGYYPEGARWMTIYKTLISAAS